MPTLKKIREIGFDIGKNYLKWYNISSLCKINEEILILDNQPHIKNVEQMENNQVTLSQRQDIASRKSEIYKAKVKGKFKNVENLLQRNKNKEFKRNSFSQSEFMNDPSIMNNKPNQIRKNNIISQNDKQQSLLFLSNENNIIPSVINFEQLNCTKKRVKKQTQKYDNFLNKQLHNIQSNDFIDKNNIQSKQINNKIKNFIKPQFDDDKDLYLKCFNCNSVNYIDISNISIEEIFKYKYRLNTEIFQRTDLSEEQKEKLIVQDISRQYNEFRNSQCEITCPTEYSSTEEIITNLKQYVEEPQLENNNEIKFNYKQSIKPQSYPDPDKQNNKSIYIKKSWGFIKVNFDSIQIQGNICKKAIWLELMAFHQLYTGQNKFGAILMDPAWPETAIKFKYTITEDQQWMEAFKLANLQNNGLLFIWITNAKLNAALEYMKQNGYQQIEIITWVKLKENYDIKKGIGYYLLHCTEHCIVGIKKEKYEKIKNIVNLRSATNLIVSKVRQTSRKPDELYQIIESLIPNGPYLEIFGRKFNQRRNWLTIGDEAICFKNQKITKESSFTKFYY